MVDLGGYENTVRAFVATLNARAEAARAAGRKPLYPSFDYTLGPRHARVFCVNGSSRSSRAFVGADGVVRRSDSWKKPGRALGAPTSEEVIAYVLGPILSGGK
jgi:hypothetical protein